MSYLNVCRTTQSLKKKETNCLIHRKFKMGSLEDSLKHLEVSLAQKQHVNYVIYGVVSLK